MNRVGANSGNGAHSIVENFLGVAQRIRKRTVISSTDIEIRQLQMVYFFTRLIRASKRGQSYGYLVIKFSESNE